MLDLTQSKLAARVSCTQPTIARLEAEIVQPSDELMERISQALGFPTSWFERPPVAHFPLGSLQFRKKAAKSYRQIRKPYLVARTTYEVAERLRARVRTLPIRLQHSYGRTPEYAAAMLRSECGLAPESPIDDIVRSIEKLGVVVLALPLDVTLTGIDGFSSWTTDGVPVICLSTLASGDRIRYTAAHELGELVLGDRPAGIDRHEAADEFAGVFLLPENAMQREMVSPLSLSSLAKLKIRWRVSIAALIMRAHRLSIISTRQKRSLFTQLSARGWRLREPANLDVVQERPRVFRKTVEVLYGEPIDFARFARECNLSEIFARRLVQPHLPRPRIGHGSNEAPIELDARRRVASNAKAPAMREEAAE